MNDLGALGGESEGARRPGWPADPYRIRRALWNGRLWLVGAAVAGVVLGFLWAKLVMGHAYMTTVVLKYEGAMRLAGYEGAIGHSLVSAAESLHRDSLLRRIREQSGMDASLAAIAGRIEYEFYPHAETINIDVFGETPQESADFAHLVTDVFLTYHRERQARRIEQEIGQVGQRIKAAEAEAQEAHRRYNEFRERHGIASLSREQISTVDSAARLRADSELAGMEMRALEAQVASLEQQLANTPKTSFVADGTSPEREAYQQLRQQLASARASLSPDHPRVQSLQMQVAQLGAELRHGGGSGTVGSNTMYEALSEELRSAKAQLATLRARQAGLSKLSEKAQDRIEAFSGIEGEASALLAEVQVNEALVNHLHGSAAALEDKLENPPSGFAVLDPGALPELPVPSKAKIIAFGGFSMVGVLLGLGIALWGEFRGLRAKTPAEIAFWGNGPVLGATGWPEDPLGLDELVAGLDDLAPDVSGELLIVGGGKGDAPLAQELARRMTNDWFVDRPAPREQSAPFVTQQPEPLKTPPPSGPYPVGGAGRPSSAPARPSSGPSRPSSGPARPFGAPAQPSTALALRPVKLVRRHEGLRLDAWDGPFEDQALRRAARLADRVVVLVRSSAMTALDLYGVRRRLGRDTGVGYVVVALPEDLRTLPDRVGKVAAFWRA